MQDYLIIVSLETINLYLLQTYSIQGKDKRLSLLLLAEHGQICLTKCKLPETCQRLFSVIWGYSWIKYKSKWKIDKFIREQETFFPNSVLKNLSSKLTFTSSDHNSLVQINNRCLLTSIPSEGVDQFLDLLV